MSVVLVVEDDPDLRSLLVTLLAPLACEIRAASSAKAGLANLLRGDIDVLITDWMLGDDTGGSMLQQAEAAGVLDAVGVIIHSSSMCAPKLATLPRAVIVSKSAGIKALLRSVAHLLAAKRALPQHAALMTG
jgi:CheY-like chemotaxis protein